MWKLVKDSDDRAEYKRYACDYHPTVHAIHYRGENIITVWNGSEFLGEIDGPFGKTVAQTLELLDNSVY